MQWYFKNRVLKTIAAPGNTIVNAAPETTKSTNALLLGGLEYLLKAPRLVTVELPDEYLLDFVNVNGQPGSHSCAPSSPESPTLKLFDAGLIEYCDGVLELYFSAQRGSEDNCAVASPDDRHKN